MNDSPKPVYRITDLATDERPRERLEHLGPQVLATSELLAIFLRVGVPGENAVQVGQRLLKEFGGITGLHRAPFDELCNQHGIGKAKTETVKHGSVGGGWKSARKGNSPTAYPTVCMK